MRLEFLRQLYYSSLANGMGGMEIRFQLSPKETKGMDTAELRENFLVESLLQDDTVQLVYSHYDRVIVGGAKPVNKTIALPNHNELKAEYFLERRELGIINVGGAGIVLADGKEFTLNKLDCLYLGKETKDIQFKSKNMAAPGLFYLLSAPAHHVHPTTIMTKEEASPVNMGDVSTSNKRTSINTFISTVSGAVN